MKLELPGRKIKPIKMPSFAASNVPAVVGETNLFNDICCIISPLTLKPTPAKISAMVRGNRLTLKTKAPLFKKSAGLLQSICFTPTRREARISKRKKNKNQNYNNQKFK